MRFLFNGVALLLLTVGAVGIARSGDVRLLLSLPVAFGLGLAKDGFDLPFGKWPRVVSVVRGYFIFCLFLFTGVAVAHFTTRTTGFSWTKVCWSAGLVLQPWIWRWQTPQMRFQALLAFAWTLVSMAVAIVFSQQSLDWMGWAAFAEVATLLVHRWILRRKERAA